MNKHVFIVAFCAFWGATWTLVAQTTDGFHLQIQLETPKEGQILVAERVPNATDWFVDTLQLKDGCAVYTGKVKYPRMTTFVLHDDSEDFMGSFSMFLDNSPTIVARGRSIKDVVEAADMEVSDCYTTFSNDEFNEMLNEMLLSRYSATYYGGETSTVRQHDINEYLGMIDSINTATTTEGTITQITRLVTQVTSDPGSEGSIEYGIQVSTDGNLLQKLLLH